MRRSSFLSLVCSTLSLACLGKVEAPDSGPTVPPGAPGSPGSDPASPDTGIARLTRTEYKNSLRDLLGDRSPATNILDVDQTYAYGIFDNNAEILSSSEPAPENYEAITSQVVEAAFKSGTATRAQLLTCDLGSGDAGCARSIVSTFARRAWRRPVASDEIDKLMAASRMSGTSSLEEAVKIA